MMESRALAMLDDPATLSKIEKSLSTVGDSSGNTPESADSTPADSPSAS
jgi:hypothetical protein